MKPYILLLILLIVARYKVAFSQNTLPLYHPEIISNDWLVENIPQKAALYKDSDNHLVLSNGLISRIFSLTPDDR